MSTKTIITIERQYGSGGHLIGQKLAEDLDIPFYDGELIKVAAKESGICEEILKVLMRNQRQVFCIPL